MREIKICMGSACFAKGNQENFEFIRNYIQENNLDDKITVSGSLCENKCAEGPRIYIDGIEYKNVNIDMLKDILKK